MRKICFRYDGIRYEIEVVREGDVLTINHQGRTYHVELEKEVIPGAYPISTEFVEPATISSPPDKLTTDLPTSPAAPAPTSAGPGVLPAPMTGTVKEIKVAVGDTGSAGQLVVIMEAMKMDSDITATATGIVAELHAGAGDNRAAGQPLLTIR